MDNEFALNISDEITFPSIPKDIVFPEELNRYLREQIEFFIHENGMLKKQLKENERTLIESSSNVDRLTHRLREYENFSRKHQFTSASTIASTKIVELSKRLRDRNSEVESLKTKYSKLERRLHELQESVHPENKTTQEIITPSKTEQEEELKKVLDKLSATTRKLREVQNSNMQLKNDLKIANKCLQQEVGETLETMTNSTNQGWRGRSQIICDLQQKNQELKEKLKAQQGTNSPEIIKRTEKLDDLTKENENLKNIVEEQKKKIEMIKSRCHVLESERAASKAKLSALIDQAERDQNLLQTLSSQVNNQQGITNNAIKQKDKSIKSLEQQNEMLRVELSKQKINVDNLTKDLNEKVEEIKSLASSSRKSSRPVSIYEPKSKHVPDERLINRLEAERSRLLELTELQASRISAERESHVKTQERLRLERQKAAKLETNLTKLELEMNSIRSGGSYSSISTNKSFYTKQNSFDIRDELELAQETIKALNTRLEIEQRERKVDMKEFVKILESNN